jgi:predicted nucleic acid-binding Zn ribbon protein
MNQSLASVSRRLGLEQATGLGDLFTRWPEIVGEQMARHVQPVRMDHKVLVVAVDHPAWATQVRSMANELLDRVSQETGMVRPERLEVRNRRPDKSGSRA